MNQDRDRESSSQNTWVLGLTVGAAALVPFEVMAQAAGEASIDLPTIDVQGGAGGNTLQAQTGVDRLPGRVQDIPQVVNVVPQEIIQQQRITTLEQALRNVPGITVAIGEANGGPNGDRFRIRGFEAFGDNYVDGLRDFGVYVRDSFNYEQVQVLKGPSSESFGVGTSGGAINTTSKQAGLGDRYDVNGSFGTGALARGTFDVNKQINETTALRINGMANRQDIADRDGVKSDRWGLAASLAMGLGTDTTWHLNYFHQHNDRTPDYGVPMIGRTASTIRRPVTEFGIPRNFYYGKSSDEDVSDVDMITSRFKTKVTDWLTFSNDTRLSHYDRRFSATTPSCDQACANTFFAGGNPIIVYGAGGGPTYEQKAWGIQNVSTGIAKFHTGFLRHELIFGLDLNHQDDKRQGFSYSPAKNPIPRLWSPNTWANYAILPNPNNVKRSESDDVALFASDRVWLTDQFSILGGVRWDYFRSKYDLTAATGRTITDADANFWSPKASLIWEPTKDYTFYASFASAANLPFGQYVASDVNPIVAARTNLDPETTDTFELGAKIGLLDGRLGLTAAVFQVTKNNAYYSDPTSGVLTQTGEKQRVRGFEAGLSGKVTDAWAVNLAYAYLDSEIVGTNVVANKGNPVPGVPKNSVSLWTTYDVATLFAGAVPGSLLVGGGFTYRDKMYIRNDEMAELPHSFSLDALISYEYRNWRVALNGYNLTDRLNYDSFFQGENLNTARAIPSAGRTVVLTVGATF